MTAATLPVKHTHTHLRNYLVFADLGTSAVRVINAVNPEIAVSLTSLIKTLISSEPAPSYGID